ncbi:hypothetical protein PSQ39_09180 [Curvibacter sp. HBC28]|uniref:Uncharacterized protein n=2 Tax=Curvibacter microcysteis TaxID=3026419 RepID=A0ABT5MI54_9BURK|nr:hypothetical protein [Curvibacter sp. HBC28]
MTVFAYSYFDKGDDPRQVLRFRHLARWVQAGGWIGGCLKIIQMAEIQAFHVSEIQSIDVLV